MTTNITVLDLEAFSGITLERLGELALERMAKSRTPDISDRWLRKTFGLADGPIEQALHNKVAENIARYRSVLPEKTRAFGEQAHHCVRLALERRYLTATPGFTIVITDDLLHRRLPSDLRGWVQPYRVCTFDCGRNAVVVSHTLPNLIVAHEVGHALSFRSERLQIGFLKLQLGPDGRWKRLGNKWFDEGVTVLWEEMSVNDRSTLPERQDPNNVYCWYRDATLALLQVLAIGQETLLAAYFSNDAARTAIEAQVLQRFNCLIDDLQPVGLYQNIAFTRRLFGGEPVEHKIPNATVKVRRGGKLMTMPPDTELIADWRELAAIFPNLRLIEPKE